MTTLYKVGGNVIEDPQMLEEFCRQFAAVPGRKILVHGGGAMASQLQKDLGQEPVKIEGRRVTDEAALKAVTMAYAGWCSKSIVATLQKYGCNAIGLAGCDANVITASKRAPRTLLDGKTVVDYGFVGDVKAGSVNTSFLQALLDMGVTPVLCAINHDGNGLLLNTNADTIASSVAAAMRARLVCCFELDGVQTDINEPSSVISSINEESFKSLTADGTISGGMIPKIENCITALKNGAVSAIIKNAGRINDNSGTEISLK
jgi:acetylglutamate kinase